MSPPLDSASRENRQGKSERQAFIPPPPPPSNNLHRMVNEQSSKDIWVVLVALRAINALCVRTFFQPDEYFQSLEPAWQMAFGNGSGAWITWEWHHQLRSSLHPALFAIIYFVVDKPMEFLQFYPQFRALILSVLPTLVQAYFAAVGDYYTWQLSERVYGTGSRVGWATLWMTMFSPWQWFCSTRTFSNCLETTMTITALFFWPWRLSTDTILATGSDPVLAMSDEAAVSNTSVEAVPSEIFQDPRSIKHLRTSLLLAGTACILRPTNALIWFCVVMPAITNFFSARPRVSTSSYLIILREAILCASIILLVSGISDRLYFGEWTFPPYQWFSFNINQDLAIFYGRNDWHYYISQGLPLLLTTYVPFTIVALWQSSLRPGNDIRFLFTTTILVTLATLSLIAHKEVRFIYPLLPLLHIITAPTISSFFTIELPVTEDAAAPKPLISATSSQPQTSSVTRRKSLLTTILLLNILIASYTSLVHQRGVLTVLSFIRSEYEALALDNRGVPLTSPLANSHTPTPKSSNWDEHETFVGFLMPCHSTPWRSQLIHPGLKAWALGCEPPIHLPARSPEREAYRDEADRFYDDPDLFLRTEIGGKNRPWPRYIVGFKGISQVLDTYEKNEIKGAHLEIKWVGMNSHWHDDDRRRGEVVVWETVAGDREK